MTLRQRQTAAAAALAAVLLVFGGIDSAQADSAMQWSITPYLWASTTTVDLSVRDTSIGGEVSFRDLLDTIDAAFMVHAEGGSGQWSAFVDLTYIDTSDTNQRTFLSVDTRSKQTILDAAVSWWPTGIGTPLSVFGGLRYSGFDDRYEFRSLGDNTLLGSTRSEKDYYDALLGLRYVFDFSDRWALHTRGDVSFGDSEGTLLLRALIGYTVGQRRQNRILFGYQYKQAEFEDGEVTTDFEFHGPMAGFNFRF
ncbi:MAG: hypothetical protein P8172_15825 [Gammaproteobacteria bacterium]|jgi:opacity protein-like surface antigen